MVLRNHAFDIGWFTSKKFDLPVISVGNITVGGTGKTPHIEYIIRLLKDQYKVAVLSRGYRRKTSGYVKAENGCNTKTIGDEPAQIKNKFPEITVAVDEKRVNGIEQLLKDEEKPEVILLDDAFQHRYVSPGLQILLVDYNRPIWSDNVLPFGRLREMPGGIKRADIMVVTKCPINITDKEKKHYTKMLKTAKETPIFFSTICYDKPYSILKEQKTTYEIKKETEILLLTGIANPTPLKEELERKGAKVTLMRYADHHDFTDNELQDIANKFNSLSFSNKIIITTEKDAERIIKRNNIPAIIKEYIYSLPINIKIIEKENMFNQIITDYVRKNQRNRNIS